MSCLFGPHSSPSTKNLVPRPLGVLLPPTPGVKVGLPFEAILLLTTIVKIWLQSILATRQAREETSGSWLANYLRCQ